MKNLIVLPDINIKQALKKLSKIGEKCLIVVDQNNILLDYKDICNDLIDFFKDNNLYNYKLQKILIKIQKYLLNNIESIIKEKSVHDGIVLIKNKFLSVLNDYGINSYESVGEEFNPDFHEAIMMKKSKKASNIILEEFQRGYKYHDKVVRHSKVIVSE